MMHDMDIVVDISIHPVLEVAKWRRVKPQCSADGTVVTVGAIDDLGDTVPAENMIAWQHANAWMIVVVGVPTKGTFVVVEGVVIISGHDVVLDEALLRVGCHGDIVV
jgi:hypothetical protein